MKPTKIEIHHLSRGEKLACSCTHRRSTTNPYTSCTNVVRNEDTNMASCSICGLTWKRLPLTNTGVSESFYRIPMFTAGNDIINSTEFIDNMELLFSIVEEIAVVINEEVSFKYIPLEYFRNLEECNKIVYGLVMSARKLKPNITIDISNLSTYFEYLYLNLKFYFDSNSRYNKLQNERISNDDNASSLGMSPFSFLNPTPYDRDTLIKQRPLLYGERVHNVKRIKSSGKYYLQDMPMEQAIKAIDYLEFHDDSSCFLGLEYLKQLNSSDYSDKRLPPEEIAIHRFIVNQILEVLNDYPEDKKSADTQ